MTLSLGPLSRAECQQLVRARIPDARTIDQALLDQLERHSGGNPLLIEEILELLRQGEQLDLDDDIPSILTELDDQLSTTDTTVADQPAPIELEPVDDITEDDAFRMSLDLARAYLEIGDQEGARDMLKQALSGARDPEHRRQIEELLGQID